MKKLIALLLAVLMVMTVFAGCAQDDATTTTAAPVVDAPETKAPEADTPDETEAPADEEAPVITLDVLNGNTAGVMEGWLYDMIFEATNIHVNYLPTNDGDVDAAAQLMMADGKLPPLLEIYGTTYQNAIQAGLLLPLDEYLDNKLCNYKYYGEPTIQVMKDLYSNGTGNLYAVPGMFTPAYATVQDYTGFQFRLDYLEEIGWPELNSYEDLTNAMIKIHELHPTTADGKPLYGMSLFAEWDGYTQAHSGSMMREHGLSPEGMVVLDVNEYDGKDPNTMKFWSLVDKEAGYYDYCKWIWNCVQAGLVDPDSKTQTAAEAGADGKVYAGQTMWCCSTWGTIWGAEREGEGIGFRFIGFNDKLSFNIDGIADIGGNGGMCIGAGHDEQTTDAALRLLNYILDPLFLTSSQNGPYGKVWELNEDGAPYVIESGVEIQNDQSAMLKDRGSNIMLSYGTHHVTPGLGGYSTDRWTWPQYEWMGEKLKLDQMFEDHHDGCISYMEYKTKKGLSVSPPVYPGAITLSDDMQEKQAPMESIMQVATWNLFYAETEDQFEQIWNDLATQIKAMGVDEIVEEYKTMYIERAEQILPYIVDASEIPSEYIPVTYK